MSIELIIYIIGYAITWRLLAGLFVEHMSYKGLYGDKKPETEDYVFSAFFTSITSIIWPPILALRVLWILAMRLGFTKESLIGFFFPKPKKVETRNEKQARKNKEMMENHKRAVEKERAERKRWQQHINSVERDLGFAESTWDDFDYTWKDVMRNYDRA